MKNMAGNSHSRISHYPSQERSTCEETKSGAVAKLSTHEAEKENMPLTQYTRSLRRKATFPQPAVPGQFYGLLKVSDLLVTT